MRSRPILLDPEDPDCVGVGRDLGYNAPYRRLSRNALERCGDNVYGNNCVTFRLSYLPRCLGHLRSERAVSMGLCVNGSRRTNPADG